MALHDYAELDENDFYSQGFEKEGLVSVWASTTDNSNDPENLDVLQDLCGIGYYNLDNQESNCENFIMVPFEKLVSELSYSESFREEASKAATRVGISTIRWIIVQYDFKFDPKRVKRQIHVDPVFVGAFRYTRTE